MAAEVVIPKMGMTMKDGTIVEWAVADGAEVTVGDVIFRLATDKLDTDVEAEAAGMLHQVAAPGRTLPVGTTVAWLLAPGEAPPGGVGAPEGNGRPARIVASPYARRLAAERGTELEGLVGSGPGGRIVAADLPELAVVTATADPAQAADVAATPVARRLADAKQIDLATITGTGPGGRITKEDVEAASPAAAPAAVRPVSAGPDHIPLAGMRGVIARRMHESLQEMAQLTIGMEVAMDAATDLRQQLVAEWATEGVKVTFTDLVNRAAVKALAQHPALNASVGDDAISVHPDVHLGLAVALTGGLVVPVVRDADRLDMRSLAAEAARLAAAARDGGLGLDDMAGSTFTVTSLGASGVDFFTPIVNAPNVAILGIGRIHDGVGWDGDRPVLRRVMTLSLTFDHRAVDGAPAAAFLASVRDLLEQPFRLLI